MVNSLAAPTLMNVSLESIFVISMPNVTIITVAFLVHVELVLKEQVLMMSKVVLI